MIQPIELDVELLDMTEYLIFSIPGIIPEGDSGQIEEWKSICRIQGLLAVGGLEPISNTTPVAISITWFTSDKGGPPVFQKGFGIVCDAIRGVAYNDDSQIVYIQGDKVLCMKGEERTNIRVWDLPTHKRENNKPQQLQECAR